MQVQEINKIDNVIPVSLYSYILNIRKYILRLKPKSPLYAEEIPAKNLRE
jgi:hypothetical protein